MTKKLYNVNIDLTVWYDRNFLVEAYNAYEAEDKARDIAKWQTMHLIGTDIPVESDGDWSYGDQEYTTSYIELEE